jgi:hypothetical protein
MPDSRKPRDIIAMGGEPQFFATHVGKTERAGAGATRLYMVSERNGFFYLEYTVVIPDERLAQMCRICAEAPQGPGDLLTENALRAH